MNLIRACPHTATSPPGPSAKKASWRKRGRGKRRRWPSEASESENTSKESCDVTTAEKTPHGHQEASAVSFSDDVEDLNEDFDTDTDDDDVRNDGRQDVPGEVPSSPDVPDMATQDSDRSDSSDRSPSKKNESEETMDMDSVDHVEKGDQKKTEDRGRSSPVPITGKIWWLSRKQLVVTMSGSAELIPAPELVNEVVQPHSASLFSRKEGQIIGCCDGDERSEDHDSKTGPCEY